MHSIEVRGVGKRFRLGQSLYPTLREDVASAFRRGTRSQRLARSEFWALRDVTFDVEDGEAVGIIGRNGAGKSTLLRILARITEPTTGSSRTRGRVGALLEVGTGFHPELTGRENVYLNGALLGMRRADISRRFDDIVQFAGVERFLDTPIKRYSSGMYLRLAFSVAAHVEPDVIVVDEVLAVGDAEFQQRSLGRMSSFAREGRTVLFVSHDLGAIARICKRAIWLDTGVAKFDGASGHAIERYLGAKGERAAYVELPYDDTKTVQLRAVAVTDESGAALDAPRRDQPVVLRVRLRVEEAAPALDVKVYLISSKGVRVLDQNLSDTKGGAGVDVGRGEWEAQARIPAILASGDYVLGVAARSPYQRFFDQEVLRFRLWPPPDERQESIDRLRIVQPDVDWDLRRVQ